MTLLCIVTDTHLAKHRLCCIKFGISLNTNKCAFMVFLGIILGLVDPKKIQAIVQMFVPSNPQQIQVFNKMA